MLIQFFTCFDGLVIKSNMEIVFKILIKLENEPILLATTSIPGKHNIYSHQDLSTRYTFHHSIWYLLITIILGGFLFFTELVIFAIGIFS